MWHLWKFVSSDQHLKIFRSKTHVEIDDFFSCNLTTFLENNFLKASHSPVSVSKQTQKSSCTIFPSITPLKEAIALYRPPSGLLIMHDYCYLKIKNLTLNCGPHTQLITTHRADFWASGSKPRYASPSATPRIMLHNKFVRNKPFTTTTRDKLFVKLVFCFTLIGTYWSHLYLPWSSAKI